jgi:hypothetical protein
VGGPRQDISRATRRVVDAFANSNHLTKCRARPPLLHHPHRQRLCEANQPPLIPTLMMPTLQVLTPWTLLTRIMISSSNDSKATPSVNAGHLQDNGYGSSASISQRRATVPHGSAAFALRSETFDPHTTTLETSATLSYISRASTTCATRARSEPYRIL